MYIIQCENFPATLILREINFGSMQYVKTAILTISEALDFELMGIPYLKMSKIPQNVKFGAAKMVKMAVFDLLK